MYTLSSFFSYKATASVACVLVGTSCEQKHTREVRTEIIKFQTRTEFKFQTQAAKARPILFSDSQELILKTATWEKQIKLVLYSSTNTTLDESPSIKRREQLTSFKFQIKTHNYPISVCLMLEIKNKCSSRKCVTNESHKIIKFIPQV